IGSARLSGSGARSPTADGNRCDWPQLSDNRARGNGAACRATPVDLTEVPSHFRDPRTSTLGGIKDTIGADAAARGARKDARFRTDRQVSELLLPAPHSGHAGVLSRSAEEVLPGIQCPRIGLIDAARD